MRSLAALVLAVLTGCAPAAGPGWETGRHPGPWGGAYPERSAVEVRRLVDDYVREVDGALGLTDEEARHVSELLEDRAYRVITTHRAPRDRDVRGRPPRGGTAWFPFPRRAHPPEVEAWWRNTDRAVEAALPAPRRRAYRRFALRYAGADAR